MKSQKECRDIAVDYNLKKLRYFITRKQIRKALEDCFGAGVAFGAFNKDGTKR